MESLRLRQRALLGQEAPGGHSKAEITQWDEGFVTKNQTLAEISPHFTAKSPPDHFLRTPPAFMNPYAGWIMSRQHQEGT